MQKSSADLKEMTEIYDIKELDTDKGKTDVLQ